MASSMKGKDSTLELMHFVVILEDLTQLLLMTTRNLYILLSDAIFNRD